MSGRPPRDVTQAAARADHRPDIDGLRAIAVLGVLAFHASSRLLPGGFIGVDVFFVISGFLISGLILRAAQRGTFSIRDFYSRRVRRIFPALAVVLTAAWLTGWFVLSPPEFRQLGKHIVGGAGFLSNVLLWNEAGYFDAAAETKPLLHLWSLGVEEQFYIFWPLLLVAFCRRGRNPLVPTIIVAALSFVLNLATVHAYPSATFYLPASRLWELLTGAALACASMNIASSPRPVRFAWLSDAAAGAGLVLIIAAMVVTNSERAFPGWWAVLPTAGTALLISAGLRSWINRSVLSSQPMVFIGVISYPLYLWHWPLLAFARITQDNEPSRLFRVMLLSAAVALAYLTYRFVERPIRFGTPMLFRFPMPAAAATMLIVPGAAGIFAMATAGEPSRFPQAIQQIWRYDYAYAESYREGRCFLRPDQGASAFGGECLERNPSNPSLLLWGDSHAAHLYPGLHHLQRAVRFNVVQLTASSCPPIVGLDAPGRRFCRDINSFVGSEIASVKPDVVMLAAHWLWFRNDIPFVHTTIEHIRAVSQAKIVIIGPVPNWRHSLPISLFNYARTDPLHRVPNRMRFGLIPEVIDADRELHAQAVALGVDYVSPLDVFCDRGGCLTTSGTGDVDRLVAWDSEHLTETGSEYLIDAIANRLLPPRSANHDVPKQARLATAPVPLGIGSQR